MSQSRFNFPEAYQRGEADCLAAKGDPSSFYKNPYPKPHPAAWACFGGSEWHAWNVGWNDTVIYATPKNEATE